MYKADSIKVDSYSEEVEFKSILLHSYIKSELGKFDEALNFALNIEGMSDKKNITDYLYLQGIGEISIAYWNAGHRKEAITRLQQLMRRLYVLYGETPEKIWSALIIKVSVCVNEWLAKCGNKENKHMRPMSGLFTEYIDSQFLEAIKSQRMFAIMVQLYLLCSYVNDEEISYYWARLIVLHAKDHDMDCNSFVMVFSCLFIRQKDYSALEILCNIISKANKLAKNKGEINVEPSNTFLLPFVLPLIMEDFVEFQKDGRHKIISQYLTPLVERHPELLNSETEFDNLFNIITCPEKRKDNGNGSVNMDLISRALMIEKSSAPTSFVYLMDVVHQMSNFLIVSKIPMYGDILAKYVQAVFDYVNSNHPQEFINGGNERIDVLKYANKGSQDNKYLRLLKGYYMGLKSMPKITKEMEEWIGY